MSGDELLQEVARLVDERDEAMGVVAAVIAGIRGEVSLGAATVLLDNDTMRTARRLVNVPVSRPGYGRVR